MVAPTKQDLKSLIEEQQSAAKKRFVERADERRMHVEALASPGGVLNANPEERIAWRVDRVTRYNSGEEVPITPAQIPAEAAGNVLAESLRRSPYVAATPADAGAPSVLAGVSLEKVINTRDFVDIGYLEAGVAASRAVCRIHVRDPARGSGYGTGSLISPRLLLTNHHVFPEPEVAQTSAIEFNYQDGLDGRPLDSKFFYLDPEVFFLADKERDFALVAVRATAETLADFGFNRLIEAEGKAIIGEFVTIIQHPGGEKKQVALRENRIVDLLENFLHYEADTEPGSSGSPVFNDQWEIVALHHASVPAPQLTALGGFMNEGIRTSRILKFVHAQPFSPDAARLVDQIFAPGRAAFSSVARGGGRHSADSFTETGRSTGEPQMLADGSVRMTVPLEVTLRLGAQPAPGSATREPGIAPAAIADDLGAERITIDLNYTNRLGYDSAFLGSDATVPLPSLPADLLAKASTKPEPTAGGRHVLPYHHFSVVMNKERRLAFLTAVNINGREKQPLRREDDQWFFDPRIPESEQLGEFLYRSNRLDRGHLVRRLDPAWGSSKAAAKRANDDTFHFTNCSPQHEEFNRNQTRWAGLEDYILDNALNRDLKVSVFTGPVLADSDDEYKGVKLPRQFWKVVVMAKAGGGLSATGYLLSQQTLLQDVVPEVFSYGAYRTYQVPVRRIEDLTRLSFNQLRDFDPLTSHEAAGFEIAGIGNEIRSSDDLVL